MSPIRVVVAVTALALAALAAPARGDTEPNNTPIQANALTSGTAVAGSIGAVGDVDLYAFTAARGDRVVLDIDARALTPSSPLDSELYLYDRDALTLLGYNDDAGSYDSHLEYVITAPGTYYVTVMERGGDAGGASYTYVLRYTLQVNTDPREPNDVSVQGVLMASGDSLQGTVSPAADPDYFAFAAGRGDRVIIDIDARSLEPPSPLDSEVHLYDRDGVTVLAANDDAQGGYDSYLEYVVAAAGTYYLQVRERGNDAGGPDYVYRVKLRLVPNPDRAELNEDPAHATPLVPPAVVGGAITPVGDIDVFSFRGAAGDTITARIAARSLTPPSPIDSEIFLLDSDGVTVLAANDDWAGSYDSFLSFLLPRSGTYYLKVTERGGDTGGPEFVYRLALGSSGGGGLLALRVNAAVGARRTPSPLRTRVGRTIRLEVTGYAAADSSDRHAITDYTWDVPPALGQVKGRGELELTRVAGVEGIITVRAQGLVVQYQVFTLPDAIARVLIDPPELTIAPRQSQTFRARAEDQYGNAVQGQSFGWHTVGGVGTINTRTGAFVAAATPADGYVIAVVSSALLFGDAGATVQGQGRVVVWAPQPAAFALLPNFPNPFNGQTIVSFAVPEAGPVRLTIYNAAGQEVARLVDGVVEAGLHRLAWRAPRMASGTYFARLEGAAGAQVRRMTLAR